MYDIFNSNLAYISLYIFYACLLLYIIVVSLSVDSNFVLMSTFDTNIQDIDS